MRVHMIGAWVSELNGRRDPLPWLVKLLVCGTFQDEGVDDVPPEGKRTTMTD